MAFFRPERAPVDSHANRELCSHHSRVSGDKFGAAAEAYFLFSCIRFPSGKGIGQAISRGNCHVSIRKLQRGQPVDDPEHFD